ncbi:MAG TPA: GvpL/GvpF family gas vesicle protein [Pyrinomonadaceae bacterium]|nr:GvpL/GvpF family gas vesicle protein [Pyrinomonadaceae bacterium]
MTRLYAYCICDGDEAGQLDFTGAVGVGGSPARAIGVGGLSAVVGDFAGTHVAVSRDDVLAHNRVNGLVLALTTPLPFRFGTLVTAERLGEHVRRNEAALRSALARVGGCVEMSVKIIRPAAGEGETRDVSESEAANTGEGAAKVGRGAAYLAARRRALLGGERLRADAEEAAARLAACVSAVVRESSVRLSPAEALAVRAAHLVERGRAAEYQSRLREFAVSRPDLRLLTSGPWPPYSFVP